MPLWSPEQADPQRGSRRGLRRRSRLVVAAMCVFAVSTAVLVRSAPIDAQQAGRLPDGALRFDPWAAAQEPPASHSVDWLASHGVAATQQSCTTCHAEDDCVECHAGSTASLEVHPPGWLLAHGPASGVQLAACSNCHVAERFCVGCHAQARLTGAPGYDPAPGFTAHPAGWVDRRGHGQAAEADLTACTSCHTENECVACHATVNPHGDGFGRDCRRLLDLGAPTCATCHSEGTTLPLDAVRSRCAP